MYSDKPNGYYPDFLIDNSLDIPNEVSEVLHDIWVQKYEELYEVDSKQGRSLLEAISKALETLQDRNPTLEHLRCVWCGYILGLAVKPTVESYSSGDCRALVVLKATQEYLRSYFQNSNFYDWKYDASLLNLQDFHSQDCDTGLLCSDGGEFQEDRINLLKELHFSRLMKGRSEGPQALDEALDVFLNILDLISVQSYSRNCDALTEILYDCLEGYAIIPGSEGRRDIFNWWLTDVIPSARSFCTPQRIYSLKLEWPPPNLA